MSAFVINRDPSGAGITIITDAAVCIPVDDGYMLKESRSKVYRIPDESGALCCVGSLNVFGLLIDHNAWTNFDSVVESIKNDLEQAAQRALWIWPRTGNAIMVALAGWSERRGRFESYAIRAGKNAPEDELLVLKPLHELEMMPGVSDEDEAIAMEKANGSGLQYLYEIMERQRLLKFDSANSPHLGEVYGIGGFMEETVITREGIRSRVVKEWPDVIGQPINPERAYA